MFRKASKSRNDLWIFFREFHLIWVLALPLYFHSCQSAAAPAEEAVSGSARPPNETAPVKIRTAPARLLDFPLRRISTGTLRSRRRADIKTHIGGQLLEMPLQPGDRLEKGDLIAALNQRERQIALKKSLAALDRALLEKNDLLIGHYGEVRPDSVVNPELLAAILVRSGYHQAEIAVEEARFQLEQTRVYTPFAGLVADLQVKPYQYVNAGETLCTLVDPEDFEVEFRLLESEALQVRKGQDVEARPAALPELSLRAEVTSVNPLVDEQGLVSVRARLTANAGRRLFEGMNVQVFLETIVPRQVVVPKSALVLRSGREVIFTYDAEEGRAKWNYVSVAYENDEMIAVSEGLEAGAVVIMAGNLNLDHDARVVLE